MFEKWFSKKDKDPSDVKPPAHPIERPVREPRSNWSNRDKGRPPAGSDQDFVYHDRS